MCERIAFFTSLLVDIIFSVLSCVELCWRLPDPFGFRLMPGGSSVALCVSFRSHAFSSRRSWPWVFVLWNSEQTYSLRALNTFRLFPHLGQFGRDEQGDAENTSRLPFLPSKCSRSPPVIGSLQPIFMVFLIFDRSTEYHFSFENRASHIDIVAAIRISNGAKTIFPNMFSPDFAPNVYCQGSKIFSLVVIIKVEQCHAADTYPPHGFVDCGVVSAGRCRWWLTLVWSFYVQLVFVWFLAVCAAVFVAAGTSYQIYRHCRQHFDKNFNYFHFPLFFNGYSVHFVRVFCL